jgi:uncharacterized membrane-anchored protein
MLFICQPDYRPQKERGGRMKKTTLLIFCLMLGAQLLIPTSMILKHERILRTGARYQFKTNPIDPADPFQGRYVWLGFRNSRILGVPENASEPRYGEKVYVRLETTPDGFCELTDWSREKPEQGDFLKLKYTYSSKHKDTATKDLRFNLPFNRFYMEENKAPHAEQLVRQATRIQLDTETTDTTTNCWANVRILNGDALIEDVLVNGESIKKLASQNDN